MALLSFTDSPHGGRQRHLPEWQSQPRITATTIIDHSIVGSAEGAYRMFRDSSSLESHFIVDLDGEIWQLMDTDRQGDANLQANGYALSIETADRGNPDIQPWTAEQIDSLIWLHEELLLLHPKIPRRRSRSCVDPGGLGYHTLHGAPSCWTPVSKSCPGTVRKGQWFDLLLPAFLNPTTDTSLEDDLTDEQAQQLNDVTASVNRIEAALFQGHAINPNHPIDNLFNAASKTHQALVVPGTTSAEQAFNLLFARVRNIETQVQTLVEALGDPVAEPPPAP
jgi:N-acetylmuramoyl-L-alanine amidase